VIWKIHSGGSKRYRSNGAHGAASRRCMCVKRRGKYR
jgi:hypothetical protein